MNIKQFFFILCFIFAFSFSHATSNFGIAFVHGTNDHRADAYGDYWKTDFIETIAKSLPNPDNVFVVHCDFSQYMWHPDAGDCTAKQLADFIRDKKLGSITVFTHSNGGNVMRWILSNPSYHSDYLFLKHKIKQVIALAPSSGGTVLADMVIHGSSVTSNLAWLLGFHGDAIKQQREGDMAIFNEELLFGTKNRPALPVPFLAIVGTDVAASPFSGSSYCNGYLRNSGLKITKLYLEDCADGFLNCDSQTAAGKVWFYDKDKLDNNAILNHNQSRHSCFGIEKLLIKALEAHGVRPS